MNFVFQNAFYCHVCHRSLCYFLLPSLRFLQLRCIRWLRPFYLNDAIMMLKCINKLVPDYLIGKFTLCSQRQRGQLYLPRCRTTTGQRSFTYRNSKLAKLWNNLGDDVKSLDSVNVFRKRLVNLLLSD